MSNNVSSKENDKGVRATGVGDVVVLILRVAIDECTSIEAAGCSSPAVAVLYQVMRGIL